MANPRALNRLMNGRHPVEDNDLATMPRRMTINDVGIAPKEQNTWSDASFTGGDRPPPTVSVTRCDDGLPLSDEDPFGFGFGIDEA